MRKLIFSIVTTLTLGGGIATAQITPTNSPYNLEDSFIVETDSNMTDLSVPLLFYYPETTGSYPVLMVQIGANGFGSNVINRHTYDLFMQHLASYGFLVIVIDDSQAGFPSGTTFIKTHDWFTTNVLQLNLQTPHHTVYKVTVVGGKIVTPHLFPT